MFTGKKVLSVVAFVVLSAIAVSNGMSVVVSAAEIPPSKVQTDISAFRLSGDFSLVGDQQTGVGSFSKGSLSAYPEAACIPFVLDVINNDSIAGDTVVSPVFDYFDGIIGIEGLENISSAGAFSAADNLSDITTPGTSISTATSFSTTAGAAVTATVSGPYSGNDGTTTATTATDKFRHYNISLTSIPAGSTVQIPFCARLSVASGAYSGASLSVRSSGGDRNMGIQANQILELPELTVTKTVVNNDGGTSVASNFTLNVAADGVSTPSFPGSTTGTAVTFNPGAYAVSETAAIGYTASYGAGCTGTLDYDQSATCTVTNSDNAGTTTVTVIKNVINNNGGSAQPKPRRVARDAANAVAGTCHRGRCRRWRRGLAPDRPAPPDDCFSGYSNTRPERP